MALSYLAYFSVVFRVTFSRRTYPGKVSTGEDPIGKIVIQTELVYNKSAVAKFIAKDYSMYRSDSSYFNIDDSGTITLKKTLPSRRTYNFQISLFFTATLVNNKSSHGFLYSYAQIKAIGMMVCC